MERLEDQSSPSNEGGNRALARLEMLSNTIDAQSLSQKREAPKPQFTSCWEYLKCNELITEKGRTFKDLVEKLMRDLNPQLIDYVNKTEFPHFIVEKFQELKVNGLDAKGFGSPLSIVDTGSVFYELARWDASVATFFIVSNCLGIAVVERCGSEAQKQRILPDCILMKKTLCFGLTEPDYGSDATSLKTSARKVEGGYLLTGQKRWIGNATFADYIIHIVSKYQSLWMNCLGQKQMIVEKGSKGLKTSKIENKYGIRMVQNADIDMQDVFVPEHNRLEKALDFATGANNILKHSRIQVAWVATGIAAGAIEAAHRYTLERKQFGRAIANFQATQEKLTRAISEVNSMILLCHRVSILYQRNKATMGQIAATKAYCTRVARDVCKVAREMCGGNGIILDNHVMKQFMDIEAIHTYEGTYDINELIAAREITGLAAFK